jgi:hypothetical protein
MAATILFSAFCISSIVFLISFFVALCGDRKHSRYVLKIHREAYINRPSPSRSESDGHITQAA